MEQRITSEDGMEDIKVQVNQTAGVIDFNYEEIKQALSNQMSAYRDITVTEDTVTEYKKDIATLRKIRKAVDDRRKEVKKTFNQPYEDFEIKVKELLKEIDNPIDNLTDQIETFEKAKKQEKEKLCRNLYKELVGEYSEYLPYEKVAKPQWTNVSYTKKDITYDISEAVTKVKSDLTVIKNINSEIEDSLIEVYKKSGNDLGKAIERNTQYLADKERAKELERQKAEELKREQELKEQLKKEEEAKKQLESKEPVDEEINFGGEIDEKIDFGANDGFVDVPDEYIKVSFTKEDWEKVKELLDFSNIKYQLI